MVESIVARFPILRDDRKRLCKLLVHVELYVCHVLEVGVMFLPSGTTDLFAAPVGAPCLSPNFLINVPLSAATFIISLTAV